MSCHSRGWIHQRRKGKDWHAIRFTPGVRDYSEKGGVSMPGFDGTGPAGMGPMTGGGRGSCASQRTVSGASGFGPRFGRGRRRMGGFRSSWFWGPPGTSQGGYGPSGGYPQNAFWSREQERDFLKEQAAALKEDLQALEDRLRELETENTPS